MDRRFSYRWLFILGFISLLIILMTYLVSEKLIRHLDKKSGTPVGMEIKERTNRNKGSYNIASHTFYHSLTYSFTQ